MSVAVVHLASGSLGVPPLEAFLHSYHAHDPGLDHRLIVVFNRFGQQREAGEAHRAVLRDTTYEELWLDEPLQDLAAYVVAAGHVEEERLCFLNANSEVLADGWLAALDRHARRPGVGLAGATGTYESHVSGALGAGELGYGVLRDARTVAKRGGGAVLTLRSFPRFPNPHLRTNGFVVEAATMRGLRRGTLSSKRGAHVLESGRRSLTRRVLATGRQVVVVGRDGEAYAPERWPDSRTFRSGDQENLLVADRRTRDYAAAGSEERLALTALAWGATPQGR